VYRALLLTSFLRSRKDYRKADNILQKFWNITGGRIDTEVAKNTWDLIRLSLDDEEPRIAAAMPKAMADIQCAVETGTAKRSHPNRIQSIDWLEENGQCLDNIHPGHSSVKQAGGGAFATRRLGKDQVIAPMPLLHFRRHQLEVYSSANVDDYDGDVRKEGSQQLLNYAYGHPESSLMLFPYSPVINYVNHDAKAFNAELRWSTTFASHHTDWLERTPDDLDSEPHAGLIMEIVATRDIEAGEEVFLNYGPEWEQAWQDYVKNKWKPTPADKRYVSATQLNLNMNAHVLKTRDELLRDEAASSELASVYTVCYIKLDSELTGKDGNETLRFDWSFHPSLREDGDSAYRCDVVSRETTKASDNSYGDITTYTVALISGDKDSLVIPRIPRAAIQFADKRYTSDLFLRTAFRHAIGIPDHMVPAAWRDLPVIPVTATSLVPYTWLSPLFLSAAFASVVCFLLSQRLRRKMSFQLVIMKRLSWHSSTRSPTTTEDTEGCSENSPRCQLLRRRRSPENCPEREHAEAPRLDRIGEPNFV
jgi:hypothetical protein